MDMRGMYEIQSHDAKLGVWRTVGIEKTQESALDSYRRLCAEFDNKFRVVRVLIKSGDV